MKYCLHLISLVVAYSKLLPYFNIALSVCFIYTHTPIFFFATLPEPSSLPSTGTGWATRLRKGGKKKREKIRGGRVRVLGQWATRLWKRGKKKRVEGRVRVLGGLLGYGREAKKERRFKGDV